jgi:membrane protein
MLAYFDTKLRWGELLKRTARETQADNGLGLAAQLAYYFFLALFPTLLFLIALAGVFASQGLVTRIVEMLRGAAPPDVINIIRDQLISLSRGNQGGIMTFGVVAALWSSSAALVALIDSLNRAYDVEDARPWWKQRLTAILLTVGVAIFVLASFALVIFGPQLAEAIAGRVGLGAAFEWTWKILQWPIVFALVATAFGLIYYSPLNRESQPAQAPAHRPVGVVQRPRTSPAAAYARTGVLFGGLITALFGRRIKD